LKIVKQSNSKNYEKDFSEITLLRGFEGGCVYLTEKDSKFYLILDESTMSALFDDEDLHDNERENHLYSTKKLGINLYS